MLVLVSGLPGSGKTTLSTWLAGQMQAVLLSVDVIEAAMHAGGLAPQSAMYPAAVAVVHDLASQHLALHQTVIIDMVLAEDTERTAKRRLAETWATSLVIVEVICSDRAVHRAHYMSRPPLVPYHSHDWGHVERVEQRYQPWREERLVLDAIDPVTVNGPKALAYLLGKSK